MNETLISQPQNTIAVTRHSGYLNGTSNQPFAVVVIFGGFKREFPQDSFLEACEVANQIAQENHMNYIFEPGLDAEEEHTTPPQKVAFDDLPEDIQDAIRSTSAHISEPPASVWVVFDKKGKTVDWWYSRGAAIRQAKMIDGFYRKLTTGSILIREK